MFKFVKKYKAKKEEKKRITQIDRFNTALANFEVNSPERGEFKEFIQHFRDHSLIMLIIGRRGAGKTALGMKLVETGAILNKKPYVIGFSNSKVPSWVKKVEYLEEIPNNSLVLIDEAGISFSARSSMKTENKKLAELLSIARHKNLSLIFITQNCMPLKTEIITEEGVKKFKGLKTGDKVLSYNLNKNKLEFKKIYVSSAKKKQLIKIETEDGKIIECSPDHKLLIKKGKKIVKKKAKDLVMEDSLFKPLSI
ncbi:hypothetical protein K8R33_04005 [archaeon]|nr:hypothetical protein [archaeon]